MDNTNEFEDYASARGLSLLIPPSPAEYSDRVTFEAWKAWQASREALVVELPKPPLVPRDYLDSCILEVIDKTKYALDKAGIKWK